MIPAPRLDASGSRHSLAGGDLLFCIPRESNDAASPAENRTAIRSGAAQDEAFSVYPIAPDAGWDCDIALFDNHPHRTRRTDHEREAFRRSAAATHAIA